jgi:uncharacterized protein (TIGR03086 family)
MRCVNNDITNNQSAAERLMTVGRDREAVAEAIRPADGAQQLAEIIPLLKGLVDAIRPEQLGRPTPCASFTVEGVLEHMIGGATAFAPAFLGRTAPAAADGGARRPVHERFHDAMDELLRAVRSPGAQERTIAAPFGEVPGSVFARFVAFDGLVHGWDIATATGQTYQPRAELVEEVDAFARGALSDAMRDGDTFAAASAAPPDASTLERLVAFTGRQLMNNGVQA